MESNVPRGKRKCRQPTAAVLPQDPEILTASGEPCPPKANLLAGFQTPTKPSPSFATQNRTYKLLARQGWHSQPERDAISGGRTLDLWMRKLSRRAPRPIAVADPTHFI